MRILLARTDRVGDTLLSLPAAEAIKRLHPDAHVTFLTRAYAEPLLAHNPFIDETLVDRGDATKPGGAWRDLYALAARVRAGRHDVAFILHPELRLNLLLWLSGVPRRVAPAAKLWQLFANVRVTQRRSLCRIHECDYNLDLVRRELPGLPRTVPKLYLTDAERARAAEIRGNGPLVGIHPGSGGSAANWPLDFYIAAARRLAAAGIPLFLTYGPGEEPLRDRFLDAALPGLRTFDRPVPLRDLIVTTAAFDRLLVSSTGPLHIAAALGVPTVSLFSPVLACSPTRWGPHPAEIHRVFQPAAGPCDRCPGDVCPRHDCMASIPVDAVVEALLAAPKGRSR